MIDQDLQVNEEFFALLLPLRQKIGRRNDESWFGWLVWRADCCTGLTLIDEL